jgi:hypothetical protein
MKGINMLLDDLIKLSPYPVYFTEEPYKAAFYYEDVYIKIEETMSYDEKVYSLAHELGHALCHKNKCKCYAKHSNRNEMLREYHAFKYSLELLLRLKHKQSLIPCIDEIIYSFYNYDEKYKIAAIRIMKTDLWKQCVKFVYHQEQLLLNFN